MSLREKNKSSFQGNYFTGVDPRYAASSVFIRYIYPDNILMYSALLLYMSAPPSFGMQSYIETEEPGKFVAAANSLYMIITLGVYVFISAAYVK